VHGRGAGEEGGLTEHRLIAARDLLESQNSQESLLLRARCHMPDHPDVAPLPAWKKIRYRTSNRPDAWRRPPDGGERFGISSIKTTVRNQENQRGSREK
jgi:hypothetical protein